MELKPPQMTSAILIIDPDQDEAKAWGQLLQEHPPCQYHVRRCKTVADSANFIKKNNIAGIIYRAGPDNLLINEVAEQIPTVIITNSDLEHQEHRNNYSEYLNEKQLNTWSLQQSLRYAIEKNHLRRQLRAQEATLAHMTHYDQLTNLPNRKEFHYLLQKAVARAKRYSRQFGILFFDIDNFKSINDSLGHDLGDKLLVKIAERISSAIRENDLIARVGSDEFAIILDELDENFGAGIAAERIMESLNTAFTVENHKVFVTASTGIATYPDSGDNKEELIKHADLALYKAKETGRNIYQFYAKEMDTKLSHYLDIKNALYSALEKDELFIHYQPKFNLTNNKIVGLEALLRWERNKETLVPPSEFISIAEKVGLILPIGHWLIDAICRDIKHWDNLGMAKRVAINLSARQLLEENFIDFVQFTLTNNDISPDLIEFELTESAVMQRPEESLEILKQLTSLGIHVTVDDFGTGYSSLNYLKRLPVSTLKIDRSFVNDICEDSNDQLIVSSIIKLGEAMNIHVIAEGIENQAQVDLLANLNCKEGQGYFLCRPNDMETITDFMKQNLLE